jgi:hypothetical protein
MTQGNISAIDKTQQADQMLNTAIVDADIGHSYEEYLEIVDQFYADGVEFTGEASAKPLVGRERLKLALLSFLTPLHVMAEIGGLRVSIQTAPIPSDCIDEQHSKWTLELAGVTGRTVRTTWCVRRRWTQSRVVNEYHYEFRVMDEPLSLGDLWLLVPGDPAGVRPS